MARWDFAQNVFRLSNQSFSPKWDTFFFSPSSAGRKKQNKTKSYFKQTLIHLFLVKVKAEKWRRESSALAPGLLKLVSYSKWESLNRAPMNITTSLDLKSPGIFVGIACALQEETPPCRLYCCFTHGTARSMCPHALSLPSYIMFLCVFFFFLPWFPTLNRDSPKWSRMQLR